MAVFQIWAFQVKAGRMADFMSWLTENIHESQRLDGTDLSIRVFRRSVAGPETGLIEVIVEYENMAAAGAATDRLVAEPDYQRIMARGAAEDSPATMIACQLLTEVFS